MLQYLAIADPHTIKTHSFIQFIIFVVKKTLRPIFKLSLDKLYVCIRVSPLTIYVISNYVYTSTYIPIVLSLGIFMHVIGDQCGK